MYVALTTSEKLKKKECGNSLLTLTNEHIFVAFSECVEFITELWSRLCLNIQSPAFDT